VLDALTQRQQHLVSVNQSLQVKNKSYALNEYLYENLGTNYPVLWTTATALNQVVEAKVGSGDPERLLRADGTGH
jgi:hypothetical protein